MIVEAKEQTVTITFDQPWERDTFQWLTETYGEDYLRKHLTKLFYEKQRAKEFLEVKNQVVGRRDGPLPRVVKK